MKTNCVVIYGLQASQFAQVAPTLHTIADQTPHLVKWIEIKFLNRILAVYADADNADTAQPALTKAVAGMDLQGVHVGRGLRDVELGTSADGSGKLNLLKLPDKGRLLFVSPPASPPSEWDGEGTLEEEPNRNTHDSQDFDHVLSNALKVVIDRPQSPRSHDTTPVSGISGDVLGSPITLVEASATSPGLQIEVDI